MEVYIPDNPKQIQKMVSDHLTDSKKWNFPDAESIVRTSEDLKNSILRKFIIHSPEKNPPVILSGHQPIFYPPGILIKELLAHQLSFFFNGIAINLVVDTDETVISFDCPSISNTGNSGKHSFYTIKERLSLNRQGEVLFQQQLSDEKRKALLQKIDKCINESSALFPEIIANTIQEELQWLKEETALCTMISEPGIRMKEQWEKRHNITVHNIFMSDLSQTDAFRLFVELIIKNGERFRTIYNNAIEDYRKDHHIKNSAQPIPNLSSEKKELPFWKLRNGKRIPFTGEIIEKGDIIFPRAITITLFCRIFLADLLIHGRGGERYEKITNRILREFFECDGAPYTVASATLHLMPHFNFPVQSRSTQEIDLDLRALIFDPGRFLEKNDSLREEKEKLIFLKNKTGANRETLHEQLMLCNEKMRNKLQAIEKNLLKERDFSRMVSRNRSVFLDRTFPFIFYNLNELNSIVSPYGK